MKISVDSLTRKSPISTSELLARPRMGQPLGFPFPAGAELKFTKSNSISVYGEKEDGTTG